MTQRGRSAAAFGGPVKGAFTFALLAAFALLSLLIVLLGARVYRLVEDTSRRNFEQRTALSYVAGKVRALDAADSVNVETIDGADVLVLSAAYGGTRYNTYIYYDGEGLCECFARADRGLNRALGDRLVPLAGFAVSREGSLLLVGVTGTDGTESALSLFLQSSAGEGNG